jgi:putative hydrolase of the HAD superfamily
MRWVVFDYGNVISKETAALPVLAGLLGVPEAGFDAVYWAGRETYDHGQADLDYWRALGAEVGAEVDQELSDRLTEVDVAGWLEVDPAAADLLTDLAEAGVPLALLSNAPVSFARIAEQQPWTKHFGHLVFSGDLGFIKPDPRIWAELADRLDAETGDLVFLDDRQVNIDGALAAGLTGLLWRGAEGARAELTRLGLLS